MGNYIDFIADASEKKNMAKEFQVQINGSNASELNQWFKTQGYLIHEEECSKMINNKSNFNSAQVGYFY